MRSIHLQSVEPVPPSLQGVSVGVCVKSAVTNEQNKWLWKYIRVHISPEPGPGSYQQTKEIRLQQTDNILISDDGICNNALFLPLEEEKPPAPLNRRSLLPGRHQALCSLNFN